MAVAEQMTEDLGLGAMTFAREIDERAPNQVYVEVAPEDIVGAAEHVVQRLGGRYVVTVGTDDRERRGDFCASHIFSLEDRHVFLTLQARVEPYEPAVESITGLVPGASWAERELQDMLGITVHGLDDSRRLVLPDDWPTDVHPLRRDVPYNIRPEPVEGLAPPRREPPPGASVMAIGPYFPVLEEPAYFRLFVDGEKIVGCDYRGFYNHRGVEKLGDSALTYTQVPFIAERICGICGFIHSTCYCEAVETAIGVPAPPRAKYIRSIMLELERVHSHLLWFGIAAHILGFDTALMQSWRMREPVMWLCERISGNRKTYGMNQVGGVRRDISAELAQEILQVLDTVEREWLELYRAAQGDGTLLMRLADVGPITPEDAKAICVVGPTARGSGLPLDARIDHPYAAYAELPVNVITFDNCDSLGRTLVRLEEVFDSIKQIRTALRNLPEGAVMVEIEEIPPGREGICTVEAPRGEAIHYVLTGPNNQLAQWRVRAPTYPNLQVVPRMLQDQNIADVPIAVGSLDPCFSCTERMEVVDRRSGHARLYSREEILELSGPRLGLREPPEWVHEHNDRDHVH